MVRGHLWYSVLVFLSSYLALSLSESSLDCVQESPCTCRFADDRIIDLTNIVDDQLALNATYKNLTYFFHPCKDIFFNFSELAISNTSIGCKDKLSLCSYNSTSKNLATLGHVSDTKFFKAEEYSLMFSIGNETNSIIELACTEITKSYLHALPQTTGQHRLILFSHQACPVTHSHGMSTGGVFLILLLVGFSTYFIGGALVLHFLRGAQGKEMIPNIEFWSNLPGLTRDGLVFVLSGCNTTHTQTAESYDRI